LRIKTGAAVADSAVNTRMGTLGVGGSSKATGATKRSGFVSGKNRKNGFQLLSNE
jgi:hypothetical protein